MTTYLGKSCSFCLPRVPFVNCHQFMYLVISLLVLRAGYGIWLYQFLIIAYLFTLFRSWSNYFCRTDNANFADFFGSISIDRVRTTLLTTDTASQLYSGNSRMSSPQKVSLALLRWIRSNWGELTTAWMAVRRAVDCTSGPRSQIIWASS